MSFARFMASPVGRIVRIVAGIAIIAAGLNMGGTGGTILAIVGALPLLTGIANVCVLAPILRGPFKGSDALKAP
ncbi:MAG: DUF2892 domain-containing protein [Acidimicrobiales bacterium]